MSPYPGSTQGGTADQSAGAEGEPRASAIDLGDVPKSATGIAIAASEPVSATAKISDDGPDGQSDFALVNASAPAKISAIAVPDQSTATVGFVNTADGDRTAIVTAYDTDGKQVDRREIAIRPSASTSVRIADINDGDVAAIRLKDPAQAVVWNLRVGQKDVSVRNSPDLPSSAPSI